MKARNLGIFIRVFTFLIIAFFIIFSNKKAKRVKNNFKQFTFLDFEALFEALMNSKLKSNYIGITSNKVNAIYFYGVNNKICFEYEVLDELQNNYAGQLVQFAKDKGFEIIKTSYGKIVKHKELEAPVYQIKSNLKKSSAIIIAKEVFIKIFNCDENTTFEIIS
jgi:hypothetical protein